MCCKYFVLYGRQVYKNKKICYDKIYYDEREVYRMDENVVQVAMRIRELREVMEYTEETVAGEDRSVG